jgi:glycosyltransferase involved in cell wall biosynthesis
MRIALITPEFVSEANFDGGLANYLLRAARTLIQLGHEPHVVVASDRDETIAFEGVAVHRVRVRSHWVDRMLRRLFRGYSPIASIPWQSWRLNRRLARLDREIGIDVAQYSSYGATALFRPRSIPAVVRLSSLESLWGRASEETGRARRLSLWMMRLEKLSLHRATRLISPSRLVAGEAERIMGCSVAVVESPMLPGTSRLDDSVYREHFAGRRYGLFFGSVGLLKGVKTLADVLPGLFERDKELNFGFVGKQGNYAGRPMLEYVLSQVDPDQDRVIHLGPLPHEKLYPIIDGASVIVLPSRIDNFPNACLEAMARGQIVVGTRGASFEELIEDGVSGFLCEIDDRKSLLVAIERALAHPDPDAIGARAVARIARLRPEVVGRDLVRIYESVRMTEASKTAKTAKTSKTKKTSKKGGSECES